jgi:hypothetical protein
MRILSVGLALSIATLGLVSGAGATPVEFSANLSGPNESPPNASPGTGAAFVTFDLAANTMRVQVSFTGLLGPDTASHIHCCTTAPFTGTAMVATTTPTFTGFPTGVTSAVYDNTFNMLLSSSYNPAFIASAFDPTHDPMGAETALYDAVVAGDTYLNIHSMVVPGGEIRGFLIPAPEPITISLFGAGLAGAVAMRRRKKKAV